MTDARNEQTVSLKADDHATASLATPARDHGPVVGLEAVLANKEARVKRQRDWLKRHGLPLVSFSVNMPGPEKMTGISKQVFQQGVKAIESSCKEQGWLVAGEQILLQETGPEGIFAIDCRSAMMLKKLMITIERSHPLGRLMDLDVLDESGKIISRKGQQMPRRKCLICDDDAVVCARSRKHPLDELMLRIKEIVNDEQCCG
ncbi:Apo-citrate lyase phosphoribosyl-dephospho-CoA transferase [Vibrio aerogenes CECT 7868]|uniref:citrate lyase holo-[acyl-carrier protein] synthase n=1 Tax=Vibrio aerogenes CECT 7868 TaxID=1216006 RepID=A0A1M5ZNQ1_9VIBR|nr:citrate lyase holo-[acyl-carrier protein] synthase [Vibrio aerogenes]SHI25831.1 Apo-citrate lyase phosphoribosyl-dephospho-CoA transferase [Vibrio aerogenes CECT 7868]